MSLAPNAAMVASPGAFAGVCAISRTPPLDGLADGSGSGSRLAGVKPVRPAACTARAIASTASVMVAGRRSGSFSSIWRIGASSSTGSSGFTDEGRGAGSDTCFIITDIIDSPVKGTAPVSSWNTITPKE